MNITGTIMLSAALSIDALGIGASIRVRGIRTPFLSRLTIAVVSGSLTAAAVFFGGLIGGALTENVVRTAGGILIMLLGTYIIIGALKEEFSSDSDDSRNTVEKAAGILTKPELGDMDRSKSIDLREALYIGAAVSADSFAAGFGLTYDDFLVPLFCAVFQLAFLCVQGSVFVQGLDVRRAGLDTQGGRHTFVYRHLIRCVSRYDSEPSSEAVHLG